MAVETTHPMDLNVAWKTEVVDRSMSGCVAAWVAGPAGVAAFAGAATTMRAFQALAAAAAVLAVPALQQTRRPNSQVYR